MEGRVMLRCGECGVTREISGEIPEEYTASFAHAVRQDGWAPRPGGVDHSLVCAACLLRFAGHETVDDEQKVQGLKGPKEM